MTTDPSPIYRPREAGEGREFSMAGRQFAMAGREFAMAGSDFAMAGSEFAMAGRQFAMAGREFAMAGKQFAMAGKQFAMAGSHSARANVTPALENSPAPVEAPPPMTANPTVLWGTSAESAKREGLSNPSLHHREHGGHGEECLTADHADGRGFGERITTAETPRRGAELLGTDSPRL